MSTNNNWNNQIAAAKTAITLNSGANDVNISTDAAETNVHIADSASTKKYVTMGSSVDDSSTNIRCGTGGATLGTSANQHSTTVGSTNSSSATTVQSGSGALNITSTNGVITANSGTGTISVSSDATNTTLNIGTGAGNKLTILGSTSGASSLALKYGTADFTLASATGTVMSALDTGEITYPLQSSFLAYKSGASANVTGDNTAYTVVFDSESFDQNADYNNGTGVFTAPVTGKYLFTTSVMLTTIGAAHTTFYLSFKVTGRDYLPFSLNPAAVKNANTNLISNLSVLTDMTAGDTAYVTVTVENGAKTVGVYGLASPYTFFSGALIC